MSPCRPGPHRQPDNRPLAVVSIWLYIGPKRQQGLAKARNVMALRHSALAAAALVVSLGGTASHPVWAASPQPTMVGKSTTAVAVVESTDPATRQILLSGPGGRLLTVTAGPEIRNFDQVQAGDRLVLTLRKAVALQLAPPGTALPPPTGLLGASRAARGALPAGAGFETVQMTVHVDSVDRAAHSVTFTDPDGESHTVEVHNPAMIRFARKLKPGDNVQIDYLQSVSIKLHAMAS